jgi:hypothetical protein
MHDLVGTELELTQEFLAQMMGVRRTSVTEVVGDLQKAGMIAYTRGRIHIVDLGQIRAWPVSATAVSVLTTGECFSPTMTPRPDSSGTCYRTAAKSQFMQ